MLNVFLALRGQNLIHIIVFNGNYKQSELFYIHQVKDRPATLPGVRSGPPLGGEPRAVRSSTRQGGRVEGNAHKFSFQETRQLREGALEDPGSPNALLSPPGEVRGYSANALRLLGSQKNTILPVDGF